MKDMTRRDMCAATAAFSLLSGMMVSAAAEQAGSAASGQTPDTADLSKSRIYRMSEMQVTNHPNGGWGRAILHGTLPTGEFVEAHETMLPPGQMPHPPHKHRNTEFLLIREGKLEYISDGKTDPEPVGPGDVIFTASNVMHGLKNIGTTPATYFVVSISKGQL